MAGRGGSDGIGCWVVVWSPFWIPASAGMTVDVGCWRRKSWATTRVAPTPGRVGRFPVHGERRLVGGAGAVGVGLFGPRIGVRGVFELFSLFALELAALAAVEGGGRGQGVRFRVLGARF